MQLPSQSSHQTDIRDTEKEKEDIPPRLRTYKTSEHWPSHSTSHETKDILAAIMSGVGVEMDHVFGSKSFIFNFL